MSGHPEPGFIALGSAWGRRGYLELGALPRAVSCARRHSQILLAEWGLTRQGDLVEVTELLVSELTTNAYEATVAQGLDTPIRLRLAASRTAVLVEVWDGNDTPPPSITVLPSLEATSGRGLLLVSALSARWDWYALRRWSGKVIWAEVAS